MKLLLFRRVSVRGALSGKLVPIDGGWRSRFESPCERFPSLARFVEESAVPQVERAAIASALKIQSVHAAARCID